jgi:hypothetical protein
MNKPIVETIKSIFSAIENDCSDAAAKRFINEDMRRNYKNALYKAFNKIEPERLVDVVDAHLEIYPGKIPKIQILQEMLSSPEGLLKHTRCLAKHKDVIRKIDASKHLCAVDGCGQPGTLSSSTTGAARWYCLEHYMELD